MPSRAKPPSLNPLPAVLCCLVLMGWLPGTAQSHRLAGSDPASTRKATAPPENASPSTAIDQLVAARWQAAKVKPAALCDDRAFIRRVTLDLVGRIPTTEEVDAFVKECAAEGSGFRVQGSAGPSRTGPTPRVPVRPEPRTGAPTPVGHPEPSRARERLVDRLLASPEYPQRMRDVFDVVFMGRKAAEPRRRRSGGESGDYRKEWLAYLERSFAENRPWDLVVREVLLARPTSEADRGAVWFLYARRDQYQEIAEAVSPAVFGVQIQCAQCHNHPLSREILQGHYWGLVSFFNRGKNRMTKAGPRVAETATGGFGQFATLAGQSLPATLSFLEVEEVAETRPAPGAKEEDKPELYLPPGGEEEPPVPRFSRREQFVQRVVKGNPRVARAAVNRFWALLMGRGLVHPVDQMDSRHTPSHPELLEWLAKDFERSGYDVRRLVRAIVLSRPYQLDSRPAGQAGPELFASGLEKPLTAEVLYRSLLQASTGKADTENPELRAELVDLFPEVFPEEAISTLRQTMFLTNNPQVDRLLQPAEGNTAARLAAIADPAKRVREAFRIAYGRDPAADELKTSVAYLAARRDRPAQATAQLWWALLTGPEFRFNH